MYFFERNRKSNFELVFTRNIANNRRYAEHPV